MAPPARDGIGGAVPQGRMRRRIIVVEMEPMEILSGAAVD